MKPHRFYTAADFKPHERGRLHQAVVGQGLSVCKKCGASRPDELALPCGRPDPANMNIDTPEGMKNAVAWQEAHIARMADGGVWAVPRSGSFYTISKATKTAVRTGLLPEPTIERVFEAMGWSVKERAEA